MKTTVKNADLKAITGVPKELNSNSGRLLQGKEYRIIGYFQVPATKDTTGKETFKAWNGVLVERLDTGAQLVLGVNTLLGQSVVFVGKDVQKASEKGFTTFTVQSNCFTSPADFQCQANGDDNGTIFRVKATEDLPTNITFKPATVEITPENLDIYKATRSKQFYQNEIVLASVKETV